MRSSIIAASAACALFFGISSASAAELSPGWHASLGVGSTKVEQDNGYTAPSAQGSTFDLSVGHDFVTVGDIPIGIEAGVRYNSGEASERSQTCDVPSCGYDEYGTWTEYSRWSGTLGVYARHPIGPVEISAGVGVQVNKIVQKSTYESGGKVTDSWSNTDYAVGPYWRLGVDYPVTDTLSVGLSYEHADLTRSKWTGNYGSGSDQLNADSWSVRTKKEF